MAQLEDRHDADSRASYRAAASWSGQPVAPGTLLLTDTEGLRHAIKVSSIQMLSDGDPCCDTTVAVVAGRPLMIPQPLEELLAQMDCRRFPTPR